MLVTKGKMFSICNMAWGNRGNKVTLVTKSKKMFSDIMYGLWHEVTGVTR